MQIHIDAIDGLSYLKQGKTRFSFAQLYLGLDLQSIPQSGLISRVGGDPFVYQGGFVPRLTIGGTHFWGYADFYVTFPISKTREHVDDYDIYFNTGIETGAKFYPWRLDYQKLRPFVGLSWLISQYKQNHPLYDGPKITTHRFPLLYGITYATPFGLFELGGAWFKNTSTDYPITKTNMAPITLPNTFFWFGYQFLIDTTTTFPPQNSDIPSVHNDWMISFGPSSAFQTKSSSFNDQNRPYFKEGSGIALFPEFGLGYYFYDYDFATNLSYRNIRFRNEAYGSRQDRTRRSIALEVYKFLFDYHGFVPYLGLMVSHEKLHITDQEASIDLYGSHEQIGLIFGWDIRPARHPALLLRTNLRYTPNSFLTTASGQSFSFHQFEFNFIEVVIFPKRFYLALQFSR